LISTGAALWNCCRSTSWALPCFTTTTITTADLQPAYHAASPLRRRRFRGGLGHRVVVRCMTLTVTFHRERDEISQLSDVTDPQRPLRDPAWSLKFSPPEI
jgi:hypothetical protein